MKICTENTAKFAGGSYLPKRFDDVIHAKVDRRTAEEILQDTIKNAGLEVID